MFSYTTRNVNVVSFILTSILFFILTLDFEVFSQEKALQENLINSLTNSNSITNSQKNEQKQNTTQKNTVKNNTIKTPKKNESQTKVNKISDTKMEWKIQIPAISLDAPIASGTSDTVMNQFVGHFEHTSKWEGNIGLAAHNRGYPVNYFNRLKELKIGDKIYYFTEFGAKEYIVTVSTIILDTDWSYLEQTQDNRITLITCVEDVPEKRRCIQAKEI